MLYSNLKSYLAVFQNLYEFFCPKGKKIVTLQKTSPSGA